MGERSTIAIWAVAALLAAVAAWRLLGGAGGPEAPPLRVDPGAAPPGTPAVDPPGGSPPGAAAAEPRGAELYVHVAGAVRRPGLLRLPAGSRVADAVEQAGGAARRGDLTFVNLAARLQDGQQIVVPVRGAAAAAPGPAAVPGSGAAAPIHLSTATVEQLEAIDGIGPTLAGRIVEYRDLQGGIRSIDELAEVDGIGEQRLATLREALQP